ncbi:MAG TPA: hypothetical protein VMT03_23375 [Polyangia bacterium]|nr:hypothetical protein [Polyangia bacterium]
MAMRSMATVGVVCAAFFIAGVGCSSGHGSSPGSGDDPWGGHGAGGAGAPTGTATGGTGGAGSGGAAGAGVAGASGQSPVGCSIPTAPPDTWVEILAPSGLSNFDVTDVFAAGTNDLLFAGYSADPTDPTSLSSERIVRWTHGCWSVDLAIPPSADASGSPSVHGTGPDDIWATTGDVIYHRDAQGWTPFTNDSWRAVAHPLQPPTATLVFNRVRAAAANDFWIAATSNVLHWDGAAWTAYNFDDATLPLSGVAYQFGDIWIDSPSQVWVVGSGKMVGNMMSAGFIHGFDGASWTHTGVGVGFIYPAIWRGGTELWLAMDTHAYLKGQSMNQASQHTTLLDFDGTEAWAVEFSGLAPAQGLPAMYSVFGHGASDMWAAGSDVAHFDGQAWSVIPDAPAPVSASTNTLVTGDEGSVWLVTPGPRFFRKATSP